MCDCARGCSSVDIEIQEEPEFILELVVEPTQITILADGTQGPQGPAGPPGPSGTAFIYTQTAPVATWIINHNLGRIHGLQLYTLLGVAVWSDFSIETVDLDTTTVTFADPQTGYAVLT